MPQQKPPQLPAALKTTAMGQGIGLMIWARQRGSIMTFKLVCEACRPIQMAPRNRGIRRSEAAPTAIAAMAVF